MDFDITFHVLNKFSFFIGFPFFSISIPVDKEARHSFIVTGNGALPEDDVPGFRTAVEELSKDFTQLSGMLLTVSCFFFLPYFPILPSISFFFLESSQNVVMNVVPKNRTKTFL